MLAVCSQSKRDPFKRSWGEVFSTYVGGDVMGAQVKLEKREDLERLIEKWRERQEQTGRNAKALHDKTKSYFVQIVTRAVQQDAEKHEQILKAVLDCMDCTVTITPEELGELSELLSAHLDVERKTEELAHVALKKRQHYITTYLLKYILEDEKKNFALMDQLNEFKGRIHPYA